MAAQNKVRVAVNGYGVIGKRVAHAITLQEDMTLIGVVDVVADWRAQAAVRTGMHKAGLQVHGTLEDALRDVDIMIDCAPKRIAAINDCEDECGAEYRPASRARAAVPPERSRSPGYSTKENIRCRT